LARKESASLESTPGSALGVRSYREQSMRLCRLATGVILSSAALASCGGGAAAATAACPSDLRFTASPRDTVIAPGEQFTARLLLFGCAGTRALTDTLTFESSDLDVVAVGKTSGTVIGVRPGLAAVRVTAKHYHVSWDIGVTVR
jgi:hypothetical protein